MTWNDEDECELRHIGAMIEQLDRLDLDDRAASATSVLQPAYWRARLEAIQRKRPSSRRTMMLTKSLLERLDQLEARKRPQEDPRRSGRR